MLVLDIKGITCNNQNFTVLITLPNCSLSYLRMQKPRLVVTGML